MKSAAKKTPALALKLSFSSWLFTLLVFSAILWDSGSDLSQTSDFLTLLLLAAFLGGILAFLVFLLCVLEKFSQGKVGVALRWFLLSVVVLLVFFVSLFSLPSQTTPTPETEEAPPEDSFLTERSTCSEQETLLSAKNCTVLIMRDDGGHGSGFSIAPGFVVTNKHVIEDAKTVSVWYDQEHPATLWNFSPTLDLAVLQTEASIPTCPWFDSSQLEIAEQVYALGWPEFPEGESTVTKGVFSRLNNPEEGLEFIQTDAAINPGNSGGPLVNECGIVGINTEKLVWSEEDIPLEGLGNALSSASIAPLVSNLLATGRREAGFPRSETKRQVAERNEAVTRPNIDQANLEEYLSHLKSVQASWQPSRGQAGVPQDQLARLLDSLERQIQFSTTLLERLKQRPATQDDVIMWDAIVKMSYESAELSQALQ